MPATLSSKCIDLNFNSNHFDCFIRIKSTGFSHIKIPIIFNKPFNKRKNWKLLGGISISENQIILSQETETPELKNKGQVVGADTGISSIAHLSDKQTSKPDNHGHTLNSILSKLSKKKKGSKAYKRIQAHRKNHINWSINQLNLTDIKEIKLEKINTFTGSRNKFLSSFTHGLISDKLMMKAEESGVRITLQSCTYKSQRCSGCGIVRKANRKGKNYNCKNCGLVIDADLNSSINNSIDLPIVTWVLRQQELNRKGFFWKEEGFFDLVGQELRVPDTEKS